MVRVHRKVLLVALFALCSAIAAATPFTDIGGLTTLYAWPEDPANIVLNPGFESGAAPWLLGEKFSADGAPHTGLVSLRLRDADQALYYTNASQTVTLPQGYYNLRGWVQPTGLGTTDPHAGLDLRLCQDRVCGITPSISGTASWTQLRRDNIALPPGQATVFIGPYRKPNGQALIDDMEVHRQVPAAVEGFLLYPNYRGLLFSDRSQTISVSAIVRPTEAGTTFADADVRIALETLTGARVASQVAGATAQMTLTVDASLAPLGSYNLRLQLLRHSTVATLFEYPAYRIVKVDGPSARSALSNYIDSDNVAVLGGQRKFVLGVYDNTGYSCSPSSWEPEISAIAQAPINIYLNYWLGSVPTACLSTGLLTALRKHGMSYLHTVNNWYAGDSYFFPTVPPCQGQTAAQMGQDPYTTCRAKELSTVPGMAGWYTADERSADRAALVFNQYRLLRSADQQGFTFIAQNIMTELPRWHDATDVMGVDPYPIYGIPLGQTSPLEQVTTWTSNAQDAVQRARPVWAVIQFFQFGSQGHWPTQDELRSMSYMAIIEGAKGLLYWSYGQLAYEAPADAAVYWRRLVNVTTGIKAIEPALLSPDAPRILAGVSPGSGILVLAKEVGGTRYLITVNNTPQSGVVATFTLVLPIGRIDVLEEGRTITRASPSTFSDTYGPYQVHVYRILASNS